MAKSGFPIPDGVTEVEDEYQLELVHFELKNLKPKGTILFSGESKEIGFQFFAGEHRADGIIARLSNAQSLQARRIFDYLEKYTKIDALITVTLLQFKLMFLAARISVVYQNGQRHLKILFPTKILKTHRRKFIRVPDCSRIQDEAGRIEGAEPGNACRTQCDGGPRRGVRRDQDCCNLRGRQALDQGLYPDFDGSDPRA